MNNTLEIERYTQNLLTTFNNKHKTTFNCSIGISDDCTTTSRLDKSKHKIVITTPSINLDETKTEADIEALKILIGHELSHHIYANMSLTAFGVLKMSIDNLTGKYSSLLLSCCIETAADLQGKKMYLGMTGKQSISDEIYDSYFKLIEQPFEESAKKQLDAIRVGYLPAKPRIQVMKLVDYFVEDDYKVVDDIAIFINKVFKLNETIKGNAEEYIPWAKTLFKMENFPNRPNRLKKI